jgi:hypothetical protein
MNGHAPTESAALLAGKIQASASELRASLSGAGANLETIVTATLAASDALLSPQLVTAVDVVLTAPAAPPDATDVQDARETALAWKEWAGDYLLTLEELKNDVALAKQELLLPA